MFPYKVKPKLVMAITMPQPVPTPLEAMLKWNLRHSIYIRTASSVATLYFGTFDSFLAGLDRNRVYIAAHSGSNSGIHQFKIENRN